MRASQYNRGFDGDRQYDHLVDYLKTDEGKSKLSELDRHWKDVMEIAEKYGFISQAFGGVAVICTHEAYLEANGIDELSKRLRTCNVEMGDS